MGHILSAAFSLYLKFLMSIISVSLACWLVIPKIKRDRFLRRTAPQFLNEIENKYHGKYPVIIDDFFGRFDDLNGYDSGTTAFYISDSSFEIRSLVNPNLHIVIPFDDILYQTCEGRGWNHNSYYYHFFFEISRNGGEVLFYFDSLQYSHKLYKKYDKRLNGDDMFNFCINNFPTKGEYYGSKH